MANIKFSNFTAFASNPIDASSGLVAYKGTDNIQFTPAELAPFTGLYAANGTLASDRTITMGGNTLSMAQASGNTVTFSSLNNEGISIAGGFNYKISTGGGTFTIDSSTTANSNAISLQTISGGGGNASILINSRSLGANADLHLKTATKLKISLPVAPAVNYVLKADDTLGNVSWAAQTNTEYTAGVGLDLTAGNVFNANVDGVNPVAAENSSTTAARTYKVQVDSGDKLVVNVPWAANTAAGTVGQLQYTTGSGVFAATSDMVYTTDELKVQNSIYLDGNGPAGGGSGSAGIVKLGCEAAGASHYIGLEGPTHNGANAYTIKFPDATPTANQILKVNTVVSSTANMLWVADTDTNTNIANTDLNLNASRTLALGASQNLTFTGSGTSKVTFSNVGGVEVVTNLTIQKNVIIQGQGYSELLTGVTSATFDWNSGNVQSTTLGTGTVTFATTNARAGATYIISIAQTGAAVIDWGSYIKWPSTGEPTLSGSSKTDVVTLICYDDTVGADRYYGSATLGFTS